MWIYIHSLATVEGKINVWCKGLARRVGFKKDMKKANKEASIHPHRCFGQSTRINKRKRTESPIGTQGVEGSAKVRAGAKQDMKGRVYGGYEEAPSAPTVAQS